MKQRLVGAAVLVALGVIFIPMLLERDTDESRLSVKMEIPPKPETGFTDYTKDAEPDKKIEPLPSIEESAAEVKARQEPEPAAPKTQTESPGDEPSPETQPDNKTAGTESAPQPTPEPDPKPAAEPDPEAAAESGEWIVQVGSFSRRANAEVLRDKLKSAGFEAFMQSAETDTGPVYRVRVGPQDKRDDAEALVDKLNNTGGYRGIVMSYSP